MRYEDQLGQLVGRIGNEYYFVDYVFNDTMHGTPFHGATGTIIVPVSKEEADDCLNGDYIDEYLEDCGVELTSNDVPSNEWPELIWDFSNTEYWDELWDREDNDFTYTNTPYFTCVGGGRIFYKDLEFEQVYDQELLDRVMKFED